jgi:hypothetical protein
VCKWIFDVLKNAMVAGTLKYLADKMAAANEVVKASRRIGMLR